MDDNFKVPSSELIKKPTQQKKPENEKLGEKDLQQPSQSQQGIPCPYKVPKWAKKPEGDDKYYFEVLKNGKTEIIDFYKFLINLLFQAR